MLPEVFRQVRARALRLAAAPTLASPQTRPPREGLAAYQRRRSGYFAGMLTGMLGVAYDDLPVLYEFRRRDLRPLVYFASRPSTLTWALDVLAGSFAMYNTPRHVKVSFISSRPYATWWIARHGKEVCVFWDDAQEALSHQYGQPTDFIYGYGAPGTEEADNIVLQMAGLAEQRSFGRHNDGAHLVIIEDLAKAWRWWSSDAKAVLPIVLTQAHRYGIGVAAGLRYEDLRQVPEEVLSLFGWRAFGVLEGDQEALVPVASMAHEVLTLAPDEFWMDTSSDGWLKFYLPQT